MKAKIEDIENGRKEVIKTESDIQSVTKKLDKKFNK